MTVYSKLSILINGIQTNVDFSQADTPLSVRTLRITDGMSSHDINSALLSTLLNGNDASQYHHHDSLYYRKTEVTAAILVESEAARLAESGLGTRLLNIEGVGAGSISKALQDAKDFATAAVLVESTAARLVESDLTTKVATIQGIGAGSISKALQDAKTYADQAITGLIDGAEGAFDTLNEIALQLRDDETALGGLLAAVADIRAIYVHFNNAAMQGVSSGNVLRVISSNSIDVASNAAASSATGAFGIAAQTSSYGQSTKIQVAGRAQVSSMEMFTPGSRVYLATDGQATQTPPESAGSAVVLLGVACSSNEVILNVQLVSVNGASSGGGTPSTAGFMSASFGAASGTVNWSTYGSTTTEQVRLEFDSGPTGWLNVTNLGPVANGSGSTIYPLNLGGAYRLVLTDMMGMAVIGNPSMSFTYQGAGPGPGPVTYSFPMIIYKTDNGDGTTTIDWTGANLPNPQVVRLVKVTGPAIYDEANSIYLSMGTATSAPLVNSNVTSTDSYALQSHLGPTVYATSASFQIPSGTAVSGGGFSFAPVTVQYNPANANYEVSYPGSNLDQMGAVQLWEEGGSSPVVGLMAWAFNSSGIVQVSAVNTSATYVLKCTNDQQTTIVATSAPFQFPSA